MDISDLVSSDSNGEEERAEIRPVGSLDCTTSAYTGCGIATFTGFMLTDSVGMAMLAAVLGTVSLSSLSAGLTNFYRYYTDSQRIEYHSGQRKYLGGQDNQKNNNV